MQKESKSLAWVSVALLNVITLILAVYEFGYNRYENTWSIPRMNEEEFYILLLLSLALTVIPTLISYIKAPWKKYITVGIPSLSLLAIIAGFIQMNTCTGKFCGFTGLFIIFCAIVICAYFLLCYLVAEYAAPRRNIWIYIVLVLEILGIVVAALYITTDILNLNIF